MFIHGEMFMSYTQFTIYSLKMSYIDKHNVFLLHSHLPSIAPTSRVTYFLLNSTYSLIFLLH